MLFPEEDTPLLKAWIVKRLENTSDADPDVLADYMLALLGHDADPAGVRKMCEEEMPDFLGDDTTAFLNDVFEAVTYRSYRPGAPPPPPKPAAPPMMSQLPLPTASGVIVPAAGLDQSQSSGSRKRSFHDDMGDGSGGGGGGRSSKQQRRGGFGARGGRGAMGGRGAHSNFQNAQPFGQFPVAGFDPAVMESIMKMHQMGIPIPPMPGFDSPQQQGAYGRGQGPRGQQPRRRGKCRDYENKGFCTRGNSCMYEHGDNSIFVPGGTSAEEYDPSQVSLMMGNNESDKAQFTQSGRGGRGRGRGGNARGQDRHSQKQRRGRAPFSADGPINDRSKSTVVIENIPEENFTEEEVRSYFTQFGNIQEVSMQPYKRLAVVKFDNWNSANAAYRSPKVIFDNRFVKVFWYKDDASAGVVPASKGASGQANVSKDVIMGENGQEGEAGEGEAPLDMEEFRRRQEEAQKTHDEKLQKKQELERQRQELEERQRELLAKQQEEKQKLYAKIAAASGNGAAATSETGTPSSSTANGGPPSKSGGQPGSQTEMLRAQLAALEEEAKSLGIDPNAVEDDAASPWPGSFRGRGRGRGGYYRARGFAARGARGGGPRGGGGGGSPHQAYAAYSLDNRPRRVAVSGVDLSVPERDEALRQHLLGIGDFTDISFAADGSGAAEITFKDRRTAEKFFYGLPPAAPAAGPAGANAKTIPGVEGQVELSWVANTGPAPAPARATATATGDNKTEVKDFGGGGQGGVAKTAGGDGDANGDVAMDGDDNSNHNGRRDTGVAAHQDQRQAADMDYDVAAEEDFDIG